MREVKLVQFIRLSTVKTMPNRLDITLSTAFGVCRLLLAYLFVNVTATPLILALYVAIILVIINGAMLLMTYDSIYVEDIKSIQPGSLFYATDVVLFTIAMHRVHPAAFAFFQVSKMRL